VLGVPGLAQAGTRWWSRRASPPPGMAGARGRQDGKRPQGGPIEIGWRAPWTRSP
jgi:hypothetical protein